MEIGNQIWITEHGPKNLPRGVDEGELGNQVAN